MALGNLVVGFVGYMGLLAVLAGSMILVARGVASALGLPHFRWFTEPDVPVAQWRLFLVRAAAALAPWAVSFGLMWVALWLNGMPTLPPNPQLDVLDGAARTAGLQDGDRITRMDGDRVTSWDELRNGIMRRKGPTNLEVERGGEKLLLVVTPRDGKIGVTPRHVNQKLGVAAAALRASPMPWQVIRASIGSFVGIASRQERPDLRGPVGIVRETGKAAASGTMLFTLGALAAYVWLFLSAIPIFDGATSALFRWIYPQAAGSSLRGYRLERLRQSLLIACACYAIFLLSSALVGVGVWMALLPLMISMAAVMATYPLTWITGTQLWPRSHVALGVLASLFVPCVPLVIAFVLVRGLRRALEAEGFRVGWRCTPPPT